MPISLSCPSCFGEYEVSGLTLGESMPCPNCETTLFAPSEPADAMHSSSVAEPSLTGFETFVSSRDLARRPHSSQMLTLGLLAVVTVLGVAIGVMQTAGDAPGANQEVAAGNDPPVTTCPLKRASGRPRLKPSAVFRPDAKPSATFDATLKPSARFDKELKTLAEQLAEQAAAAEPKESGSTKTKPSADLPRIVPIVGRSHGR